MATKKWTGGNSSVYFPVQLILYRSVNDGDPVEVPATAYVSYSYTPLTNGSATYTYTWTGLATHDTNHNEYTYTINEPKINHFDKVIDNTTFTITNSYHPEAGNRLALKVWDGNADNTFAITFNLYKHVAGVSPDTLVYSTELDGESQGACGSGGCELQPWVAKWAGLPSVDDQLRPITYYVVETGVPNGYVVNCVPDQTIDNTNYLAVCTNKYTGGQKIPVKVIKSFPEGITPPASVTLKLMNGTVVLGTVTLPKATDPKWEHTFELPKYGQNAQPIDYSNLTVVEDPVPAGFTPVVSGTYLTGFTVYNGYSASGSVTLTGSKSLTGRPLVAGAFTFQVLDGTTVIATGTNDAEGEISFTPINYNQDQMGTHTYTIVEVAGTESGMTYSTVIYKAVVTVMDKGGGVLDVSTVYYQVIGGNDVKVDAVIFNNSYAASGSIALEVDKDLAGRTLQVNEFTFSLVNADATTPAVNLTAKNLADGSITFPAINYTQADIGKTYTYKITEVKPVPSEAGMTYDPLEVIVTVLVTDAKQGVLTVTPTYPADVTFNNSYAASGSIALEVDKDLAGRTLKAGEFTFSLVNADSNTPAVSLTATNDKDGNVVFTAINYTQADIGKTYTYKITEVKPVPSEAGMTYDPMEVIVTVTITDAGNGALTVTPTYPTDVTFNNSYTASGSVILAVDKDLAGREMEAGEFSFEVWKVTGETRIKAGEATNDINGDVSFPAINYTQADIGQIYTYEIVEVVPSPKENGMTYDPMTVTVTVSITDAGNGQLTVTPTYPTDVTFNNTYTASGSIALEVDKDLAGRTLKPGEFTFSLVNANANTPTVNQTATNDKDGNVVFTAINYTQADIGKIYTYTIKEVKPASPEGGMVYDTMEVTVTVTVTDAGNGVLTVTPAYSTDVIFNNTYTASGSVTPVVTKELDGRDLTDNAFSFQLYQKNEAGEWAVIQTVQNTAAGAIPFSALNYTQDDIGKTYYYMIKEVVPAPLETGMTIDPMTVYFKVDVTDNTGGNLNTALTFLDKDNNPIAQPDLIFNNTYRASGKAVLNATKALEGREIKAGEFTFQLWHVVDAETSIMVGTATNDVSGNIVFQDLLGLEFDQDDIGETFTFKMIEVVPTPPERGMEYDPQVIIVTVKVVDATQGALSFEYTYPASVQFENTFTITKNTVATATKIWENGPEADHKPVTLTLYRKIAGGPLEMVDAVPTITPASGPATEFKYEWTGLDDYDINNNDYTYYFAEEPSIPGYTRIYSASEQIGDLLVAPNAGTVTNSYLPPTNTDTPLIGTKEWYGGDPANRPMVWLQLVRQAEGADPENVGSPVALDGVVDDPCANACEFAPWQAKWIGYQTHNLGGKPYSFSVKEVDAAGNDWRPENYTKVEVGLKVTNTYNAPMNGKIEAVKIWDGGPAVKPAVWVSLFRVSENVALERVGAPVMLDGSADPGCTSACEISAWNVVWTGLAQTDDKGKTFTYSINETDAAGNDWQPDEYTKTVSGYTVRNVYTPPTNTSDPIIGVKVWVGGAAPRPAIWFQLYRDSVATDPAPMGSPVALDGVADSGCVNMCEFEPWKVKWVGGETKDSLGNPYTYFVKEVDASGADLIPAGYTKVEAGLTVTNTLTPTDQPPSPVSITVTKIWSGGPLARPTIQVQLYQDGKPYGDAVTFASGTTTHTWTNLPAADPVTKKAYVYTVDELKVPDKYNKSVSGYTITNTYTEKVQIPYTGDNNLIYLFGLVMLLSLSGGIVLRTAAKKGKQD